MAPQQTGFENTSVEGLQDFVKAPAHCADRQDAGLQ
jgi:hypothetical protein